MRSAARAVISGLGVVSPLGCGVPKFWNNLLNRGPHFEILDTLSPDLPSRVVSRVGDFDFPELSHHVHERRISRHIAFSLAATLEALSDAKLFQNGNWSDDVDSTRVGVFCGTGFGGMSEILAANEKLKEGQYREISPFLISNILHNMPAAALSLEFGIRGPSFCPSAACATGSLAIGLAVDCVRSGRADIVLAGATESALDDVTFSSFCRIGALAKTPENIGEDQDLLNCLSRPFDAGRNGFVIGEGCGIVVVESLDSAIRRGIVPKAEIVSHYACSDAQHLTQTSVPGLEDVLEGVLHQHQHRHRPDLIVAHATSTPSGDEAEYQAVSNVLSEYSDPTLISAPKGATGHLLGAAGAVEAIAAVKCLETDTVFPTYNYEKSDFLVDDSLVIADGHQLIENIELVLCNSFGFGGTNSALLLRKWD